MISSTYIDIQTTVPSLDSLHTATSQGHIQANKRESILSHEQYHYAVTREIDCPSGMLPLSWKPKLASGLEFHNRRRGGSL